MEIDYSERVDVICEGCDDSGWFPKSCAGTREIICGRTRLHLPHSFSVPCPCRGMNRNYQAKLASQGRAA
jgi:hypothetical protein